MPKHWGTGGISLNSTFLKTQHKVTNVELNICVPPVGLGDDPERQTAAVAVGGKSAARWGRCLVVPVVTGTPVMRGMAVQSGEHVGGMQPGQGVGGQQGGAESGSGQSAG
jgi:hypothetical protein